MSAVQTDFCRIAFPPLKQTDPLGQLFRRNLVNFLKQRFLLWEGNGYFDNDNGQPLLFYGNVMDIMVDNGEI